MPFQFGLSTLIWCVVFAAFNCWLFSLGTWGGIIALVIDKHVLVAYMCMVHQRENKETARPPELKNDAATNHSYAA